MSQQSPLEVIIFINFSINVKLRFWIASQTEQDTTSFRQHCFKHLQSSSDATIAHISYPLFLN